MPRPPIVPAGSAIIATPGKDGSNVLPTDTAIAAAIGDGDSQTAAALSAAIAEGIASDETVVAAAADAVSADIAGRDLVERSDPGIPAVADAEHDRPDFVAQWLDSADRMTLGVQTDGTIAIPALDAVQQTIGIAAARAITTTAEGYLVATDGTPILRATTDGTKIAEDAIGLDGTAPRFVLDAQARRLDQTILSLVSGHKVPIPVGIGAARDRDGGIRLQASATTTLVALGDSITYGYGDDLDLGGWPGRVGTATGKTIINLAVSGHTSTEMAISWGSIIPLLSVSSDVIAASGATTVTAITPTTTYRHNLASGSGVVTTWHGILAGVEGTLAHDVMQSQSAGWTFTPDTAPGSAVACPAGTPFIADLPTSGGDAVPTDCIYISALGVNNFPSTAGQGANTYLDAVRDAITEVGRLSPTAPKFFVVSIINSLSHVRGTASYSAIREANAERARIFGDRFLDVRGYMVANALSYLTAQGVTPTSDDTAAVAGDTIPPSLRTDDTHPNGLGYNLYAQCVEAALTAKGW